MEKSVGILTSQRKCPETFNGKQLIGLDRPLLRDIRAREKGYQPLLDIRSLRTYFTALKKH